MSKRALLLTILILVIIGVIVYFYILQQNVTSALLGNFSVDDSLIVKVNGVEVYRSPSKTASNVSVNIPNVKTGDKLDFVVHNIGGPSGFHGNWVWNNKVYNVNRETFPMIHSSWLKDKGIVTWGGFDKDSECRECDVVLTWVAQ